MKQSPRSLEKFLARNRPAIQIELTRARGSSPRNQGTTMFVTVAGLWGTIGGGQLEHLAIEQARKMLAEGMLSAGLDVPLGPEIGQCCGGRVELTLLRMRKTDKKRAVEQVRGQEASFPHVYIMGAGHVGRALASQLQFLPVRCILIDTRANELRRCDADVETRLSAIPEVDIHTAPSGSAFIVFTHDHALDFLLTSAALERNDAAYVGMIGSATKRNKFRNWASRHCGGQTIDHLICPIGANGSDDKRPEIIAAFVVAEVMAELTSQPVVNAQSGAAANRQRVVPGEPERPLARERRE